MAEQQQTISAPFPAPPPFYQNFTKQNLSRLRQLRKEASSSASDGETQKDLDIFSLPTELRYLIPPSPPSENKYRSFGKQIDLDAPDATLEDAGIEQMYPSDPSVKLNPQPHLIALTRSLLTTFLSLVGILSQNPAEYYEERVESLQTIMYNIHDLINQYRPHQARESLLLMMEEKVARMEDETRRIREAKGKVEDIMKGLKEAGEIEAEGQRNTGEEGVGVSRVMSAEKDETHRARQRKAWAMIEKQLAEPS